MTVVGSQLPPEIYEIVEEAGADNCFWWSNRWRQGKKPPVGNAVSEMTNTVPGSSIEATQTTDSAKAISDNDGYDFQGDDRFDVTAGVLDPSDGWTIAVCLKGLSMSGIDRVASRVRNPSQNYDTRFDLSVVEGDPDEARLDIYDDAGDRIRINQSLTDVDTSSRFIVGGTYRPSVDEGAVWAYDGGDVLSSTRSTALGTISEFTDAQYGNLPLLDRHMSGILGEILEAGTEYDEAAMIDLILRMGWRQGV